MSDPDITPVLENANIAVQSDNVHYCVMEDGIHSAIIDMFKKAYNIHVITFPKGNFKFLEDSLIELASLVAIKRQSIIE
jgi:hypothetical protein